MFVECLLVILSKLCERSCDINWTARGQWQAHVFRKRSIEQFHMEYDMLLVVYDIHSQWRNRRGAECPPQTSGREISADLPGKKKQGKRKKG